MAKRRRKMSALQAKYFGGGRKRRASSTRRRRGGGKRRAGGGQVIVVRENSGRRKLSKRSRRRSLRLNPRRRFMRRRLRRNPLGMGGFVNNMLVPAAVGAGGAVAVDYLCNNFVYGYLPASLQTPTMQPITKIGVSLLLGWGVGMAAGSKIGGEAAAGGIIVALYNFLNQEMAASGFLAPGAMPYAAGTGYAGTGAPAMNRYMGFIRRRNLMGNPLDVAGNLGAGPYNQTKFRMINGGASGRDLSGYIGPARTLGRHINSGR